MTGGLVSPSLAHGRSEGCNWDMGQWQGMVGCSCYVQRRHLGLADFADSLAAVLAPPK